MWFIQLVENEIKKSGVDYEFKYGNRHIKILVGGIFCGISPIVGKGTKEGRAAKNVLAQVRRQIKITKEKTNGQAN